MTNNKTIQNFMTTQPHSIGAEQPLAVAREMMRTYGIRHLPVKEGGQLVGILSDRDIDFALRVDAASAEKLKVIDAATSDVYVVPPSAALQSVASKMANDKLGCALVEDSGKLLGIFTTTDACRALAQIS
jgi:acetoin utilization protein AcuB